MICAFYAEVHLGKQKYKSMHTVAKRMWYVSTKNLLGRTSLPAMLLKSSMITAFPVSDGSFDFPEHGLLMITTIGCIRRTTCEEICEGLF